MISIKIISIDSKKTIYDDFWKRYFSRSDSFNIPKIKIIGETNSTCNYNLHFHAVRKPRNIFGISSCMLCAILESNPRYSRYIVGGISSCILDI